MSRAIDIGEPMLGQCSSMYVLGTRTALGCDRGWPHVGRRHGHCTPTGDLDMEWGPVQ